MNNFISRQDDLLIWNCEVYKSSSESQMLFQHNEILNLLPCEM